MKQLHAYSIGCTVSEWCCQCLFEWGFVTALRSPIVLATNRCMIDQRYNPIMKLMLRQDDMSWKVPGWCQQKFFCINFLLNYICTVSCCWICTLNTWELCDVLKVSCDYVADIPLIWIKPILKNADGKGSSWDKFSAKCVAALTSIDYRNLWLQLPDRFCSYQVVDRKIRFRGVGSRMDSSWFRNLSFKKSCLFYFCTFFENSFFRPAMYNQSSCCWRESPLDVAASLDKLIFVFKWAFISLSGGSTCPGCSLMRFNWKEVIF